MHIENSMLSAGLPYIFKPLQEERLTCDTLSKRALLTRKTAALIMFLSSSLEVLGDSSKSLVYTPRMALSL